jgi:hypothetical protein
MDGRVPCQLRGRRRDFRVPPRQPTEVLGSRQALSGAQSASPGECLQDHRNVHILRFKNRPIRDVVG